MLKFDEAIRAATEAHDAEIKALREALEEEREERQGAERAASENEEEASNANDAARTAREEADDLLKDKELLIRLLGWSEHEFDCQRSRLLFADPAKVLHERLAELAGV